MALGGADVKVLEQDDPNCLVDFIEPLDNRMWLGTSPLSRGYRQAAACRMWLTIFACSVVALSVGVLLRFWRLSSWLAIPGIVLTIVLSVLLVRNWQRSRFCQCCGARTKSPRETEGYIWCPACHGLADPKRLPVEPVSRLDVTSPTYVMHADPVIKCLYICILVSIKDHAQSIAFNPKKEEIEIGLLIEGKVYELVPPPRWTHLPIVQTIKAIAGLDLMVHDQKQNGHIDISCGGHPIPAAVVIEPTEFGEKATLRYLTEYWVPAGLPAPV